jgi:hypothetical protein
LSLSSRASQARAYDHHVSAVRGEMPRTWAHSASVMPPKCRSWTSSAYFGWSTASRERAISSASMLVSSGVVAGCSVSRSTRRPPPRLAEFLARRQHKRGAIPDHLAPIVERLGLTRSNWLETLRGFGRLFKQAAGRSSSLIDAAARRSRRWFQARRPLEPPLCRPLARHRALNRHLRDAFTRRARPICALPSWPGA